MIDTDKYEGHTPAPWMNLGSDANSLLMQDAPLLLEFYKRVKEIMDIDEILETSRVELIWMALQEMSA
jgi:hypothetical protein